MNITRIEMSSALATFAAVEAEFSRMNLIAANAKEIAMNVIENGVEHTSTIEGADWRHSVTRDAGGAVVSVDVKIGGLSASFASDGTAATYPLNPDKGWAWLYEHGYLGEGERRLAAALQQCQPHGPRNVRIVAARRSMKRGDVNPTGTADRVLVSMDGERGARDRWVAVADIRVAAANPGETAEIYRALLAEINGHLAVMPRKN